MMADVTTGVEASAISVLKRAVEMDTARRFDEALVCYQEGINLLLQVLKATSDKGKKERFRQKISDYMDRAEQLKTFVSETKKASGTHEQIQIEDGATGFGMERLFSRFITEFLTEIEIEDPYIRSHHQICNLLRFCELVVKSTTSVKQIKLLTGRDDSPDGQAQQQQKLNQLKKSLQSHGIQFSVSFHDSLHDREIRFNTGWIVKIGRGLDIYKPTDTKFSIGFFDLDLRPCHKTTVDIFHSNSLFTSKDDNV